MIAADTSTWIAFLEGERAPDTELLDQALRDRQLLMVPVVLTELLSDPKVPVQVARTLCDVPAIEIGSEYWQRAGALRAKVLAKRRRARLGDALIAQRDRKSTRLNSSHGYISYAVFCLKKKKPKQNTEIDPVTLQDGRHRLVHNPLPRYRSILNVALSSHCQV